jgi:amino acid transporter
MADRDFGTNRVVGWSSLAVGVGTGLMMGFWSFDGPVAVPQWLGEYGDTSRRLARLGHIAFLGLGILNILLAAELGRFELPARARQTAAAAMNFGNIFLPLTLWGAAAYHPLKYTMPFPAVAVFVALLIAASGAARRKKGSSGVDS